jgi:hypothetical protein
VDQDTDVLALYRRLGNAYRRVTGLAARGDSPAVSAAIVDTQVLVDRLRALVAVTPTMGTDGQAAPSVARDDARAGGREVETACVLGEVLGCREVALAAVSAARGRVHERLARAGVGRRALDRYRGGAAGGGRAIGVA